MSRKHFQNAVTFYQAGKFDEALQELNKAVSTSSQPNYQVLDTRAAVYAKLGRPKDALKDAKATIEAAPERWQGYARAARLFLASKKTDASNTMITLALEKVKEDDATRHASLLSLQSEIEEAVRSTEARRRQYTNHSANLPLEIFGEIVASVNQYNDHAFVTMSHVCKSWRSAIQNMPLLWNNLVLTGRHTKRKAALWLEMSQGNIRELDIREQATLIPEFPSVCLKGLKWEGVRVFKTERWNPQDYLISIGKPNGLDAINHLDVAFWHSVGFSIPAGCYQCLTDLHLRTLTMPNVVWSKMVSVVTNLKSLTLRNVVFETPNLGSVGLTELINANHSLEYLFVENTRVSLDDPGSDGCWEHITSLILKKTDEHTYVTALLPGLRTLHIENGVSRLDQFFTKLASNVPAMPSLITTLVLQSCPLPPSLLVDVLPHLHELQKLEISNVSEMANPVTEALAASYVAKPTDTPAGPLICPNLIDISFSGCSDLMTGPVVRMIRSRLQGFNSAKTGVDDGQGPSELTVAPRVEKIQSLKIDECPKIDPEWLGWIRNNVKQVSCVYMKKKAKFRTA